MDLKILPSDLKEMMNRQKSQTSPNDSMPMEEAISELRRMIKGFQISQAIHVAAVLHVADQITEEARSCDDIASAIGVQPFPLYRLLRALAALGIFHEHDGKMFSLTPMGRCLRSDSEQQVSPFAILMGQAYYQQAWGQLLQSIKTGNTAFVAAHGMTNWQYRKTHPEQNAIYNAAMTENSNIINQAILKACNLNACPRIADIGGGQGSLLAEILQAYPQAHGVLFDQPHVVSDADLLMTKAGVRHRCEIIAGDMFESIPGGCDAYCMKYVLHDWNDQDVIRILANCRRDIPATALLFVIEQFLGPPNQDSIGKFVDLNMMVGTGGQERTREELGSMLGRSGFQIIDMIETETPLYVTVAQKSRL
jgi:hypothetical protein